MVTFEYICRSLAHSKERKRNVYAQEKFTQVNGMKMIILAAVKTNSML